MADTNTMNYFDMKLSLISLLDDGQVEETPHPAGAIYRLTDSGRFTVASYVNRLPLSRRTEVDLQSEQARRRFSQERQAPAWLEKPAEGGAAARLLLLQGVEALLELRIPLGTEERWTLLQGRWQRHAAEAYRRVMLTLTDDAADSTQAVRASAALEAAGDAWLLTGAAEDGFELRLLFEDRKAAEGAADRFPLVSARLLADLKNLLDTDRLGDTHCDEQPD